MEGAKRKTTPKSKSIKEVKDAKKIKPKAKAKTQKAEETVEVVLCLDPAITTGWCLVKIDADDSTADILREGILSIDSGKEYVGDMCLDLMNQVRRLIRRYSVTHLTIEEYFFSKRFATGSTLNVELRAAIYILVRELKLEYTMLNVSAWKTFVAGRATPTKEQKRKWGAAPAKKLYIQQALWERYNFRFPNYSLSSKTGRPIAFKMDVVDAVAQCVYFCRMLRGVREVTRSVKVPEDHPFKTESKKRYIYE